MSDAVEGGQVMEAKVDIAREFERRFRSRTGTGNPYDVVPETRVTRSEMMVYANEVHGLGWTLADADKLQAIVGPVYRRLVKELCA